MPSLSARGVRWSSAASSAGRTRFLDADWDGEEPDVAVTEISLSIDGNRFNLGSRIIVHVLHACRRAAVCPACAGRGSGSRAALLQDMKVAASIDHSTLSGSGFKVVTDEEGGGWREQRRCGCQATTA